MNNKIKCRIDASTAKYAKLCSDLLQADPQISQDSQQTGP